MAEQTIADELADAVESLILLYKGENSCIYPTCSFCKKINEIEVLIHQLRLRRRGVFLGEAPSQKEEKENDGGDDEQW